MRSVEITRATVAAGRRVEIGEIIELTDADAVQLLSTGKAVPIVDAPVAENRDDEVKDKTSKRKPKNDKKTKEKD